MSDFLALKGADTSSVRQRRQHPFPGMHAVVERPHAQSGGAGYALTGHHELLAPLLAACLIESQP
jgi:hypothetical protein